MYYDISLANITTPHFENQIVNNTKMPRFEKILLKQGLVLKFGHVTQSYMRPKIPFT